MFVWNFFASLARSVLPERAIKYLRGDFKSVHGRLHNRWERTRLQLHQLRGGSYLDWYAKRMDGFAANPKIDQKTKKEYHDSGGEDLETLKQLGLKKSTVLHEFGCGFLRSAHYFIDYLDLGKFSANDASGERIRSGVEYIKATYGFDILAKNPELIVNKDNSFDWLDRKPDIIWCHAVFTHMPEKDIEDVIAHLPKVMTSNAAFYFTYSQKPSQRHNVERMGAQDWWHKHGFFSGIADKHGLMIEDLTDFLQERGCYRPEHGLGKLTLAR